MASQDQQSAKPPRRLFRFSLRTLMLLVALVAVSLQWVGWVGWKVDEARSQRLVVAELQKMNAQIIYDYEIAKLNGDRVQSPPRPKWLSDLLGKEYFVEVRSVRVGGLQIIGTPQVTDDTFALIAKLSYVKYLTVVSDRISGTGLVHLAGLTQLTNLWAEGWITDSSLEYVSKLEGLESLNIDGAARITDRGLAQIAKLNNLRYLRLGIGASSSANPQDYMKITDEGLINLYGLKNLAFLGLNTIHVTEAGIDSLKKALPNCKIEWNPQGPNGTMTTDHP